MGLCRTIPHKPRRTDPGLARFYAKRPISRSLERHNRRQRGARDDQPACILGKANHLATPFHNLPLDIICPVVAPTKVRVHRRRRNLGNHIARCAASVNPAEKTRMRIANPIGQ